MDPFLLGRNTMIPNRTPDIAQPLGPEKSWGIFFEKVESIVRSRFVTSGGQGDPSFYMDASKSTTWGNGAHNRSKEWQKNYPMDFIMIIMFLGIYLANTCSSISAPVFIR